MFAKEKLFSRYCVQHGIEDTDPRRADILTAFCIGFDFGTKYKADPCIDCTKAPVDCVGLEGCLEEDKKEKGFCEDCDRQVNTEVYNDKVRPPVLICGRCGQPTKPF
jgi:hypothetical protein